MSNFVVKIVSDYNFKRDERSEKATKTRIISANTVDVDTLEDMWIVTVDEGRMIYEVPFNILPVEWMERDGVTTAVYIENANGKTTQSIRSIVMTTRPEPVA